MVRGLETLLNIFNGCVQRWDVTMEGFGEPRLNLGTGRENCTLSQPPSERRPRLLRTLPDAPTNLFL
jgi:hypothetical protein